MAKQKLIAKKSAAPKKTPNKNSPPKKKQAKQDDDLSFDQNLENELFDDHIVEADKEPESNKRHTENLLDAFREPSKKQKPEPHQWSPAETGLVVVLSNGCSGLGRSYQGIIFSY